MFTRKMFAVISLALLMAMASISIVYAYQGETPPPIILTSEQITIVGLAASVLYSAVNWVYEYFQKQKIILPELAHQALVMVVASVFAYLWKGFVFPALPVLSGLELPAMINSILQYISEWLTLLGGFFLVAHYFYKLLWKPIVSEPVSMQILKKPAKK